MPVACLTDTNSWDLPSMPRRLLLSSWAHGFTFTQPAWRSHWPKNEHYIAEKERRLTCWSTRSPVCACSCFSSASSCRRCDSRASALAAAASAAAFFSASSSSAASARCLSASARAASTSCVT